MFVKIQNIRKIFLHIRDNGLEKEWRKLRNKERHRL
jgi:hypothetical protein